MYNINEITNTIIHGNVVDVLKEFPSESIDMVITSPPYWGLRDYGIDGQLGMEPTYQEYIFNLIGVFDEVKRILKPEGTCWVNLGDCYNGSGKCSGRTWEDGNIPNMSKKQTTNAGSLTINNKTDIKEIGKKSLVGIPDRFKIAMIDNGWICRNDVIWHKSNAMCESVRDRFTVDYEHLFFFVKSRQYYFDQESVKEPSVYPNDNRKERANKNQKRMPTEKINGVRPGSKTYPLRNKRSVWTIPTRPLREAHFATFPEKLINIPIMSSCPESGIVLDIFFGSGTAGIVAKQLNRNWIGIELNPEYIEIANKRL
jgi:DNA modification methylase